MEKRTTARLEQSCETWDFLTPSMHLLSVRAPGRLVAAEDEAGRNREAIPSVDGSHGESQVGQFFLAEMWAYFLSYSLSVTSRHAPLLEQAVLCDFITEGHCGRHLRRMREVYAERLSVLMESSRQRLAGLLEISNVEAGLQTVGWLCDGIDAEPAAKAAATREVEVTPLSRYSRRRMAQEGLQLGFAAVGASEIRRGVRELTVALEEASRT